jgi:hypothetical protein
VTVGRCSLAGDVREEELHGPGARTSGLGEVKDEGVEKM